MKSDLTAPPDLRWQKVHWITPLAKSWAAILVLLAILIHNFFNFFSSWSELRDEVSYVANAGFAFGMLALTVFLVFVVIIGVISYFSWRNTAWAIDQEAVHYRHGIFAKTYRRVPYNRIQSLDIRQPLLSRPLGLGKLHIESAGGAGSHVDIAFLRLSEIQALNTEIRKRMSALRQVKANVSAGNTETAPADGAAPSSANPPATDPAYALPEYEALLYQLPIPRLLKSIALNEGAWLLVVVLAISSLLVGIYWEAPSRAAAWEVMWAVFAGTFWILLLPLTFTWTRFTRDFNFAAFVTEDGIRLKSGLLETKSQTIPPGRVHALRLTQPLLWRLTGWWRVHITIAGKNNPDSESGSNKPTPDDILLPVGDMEQAIRAMWLVVRELGVENPQEILQAAFNGQREAGGFSPVPVRARWIDWFSWKRRALLRTHTMVLYRDGFLTKSLTVVPHERIQSVTTLQGPLERLLGVASLRLDIVPGGINFHAHHFEPRQVKAWAESELELSRVRSAVEPAHDWAHRMIGMFGKHLMPLSQEGQL